MLTLFIVVTRHWTVAAPIAQAHMQDVVGSHAAAKRTHACSFIGSEDLQLVDGAAQGRPRVLYCHSHRALRG